MLLGKLALIMLLLMAIASAESLNVTNCNVIFNMIQPYEVTMPQSETSRNDTHVSEVNMISINSSDGFVIMTISASNLTTQKSFAEVFHEGGFEETPVRSIEIDNKTGWYTVNYIENIPLQIAMYYVRASPGTSYYDISTGEDLTIAALIVSDMSLYDFADFLRSLHIEPIKVKAL